MPAPTTPLPGPSLLAARDSSSLSVRWLASATALALACAIAGCSSTATRRDPTGESFPAVVGQSLRQETVELPKAYAGGASVFLIGYEQRAQFDLDRWLMGLIQAEVAAQIVEVPTMPGLLPSIASSWIDEGMRAGIPEEDWGAVVTLYGAAAEPVAALTGTESGQNARVLVLDRAGKVVWFDDNGYSAKKALAIASLTSQIEAQP